MGHDIYVEWVPYVVPPAINPVGECENLLQGTWSDSYTPRLAAAGNNEFAGPNLQTLQLKL